MVWADGQAQFRKKWRSNFGEKIELQLFVEKLTASFFETEFVYLHPPA